MENGLQQIPTNAAEHHNAVRQRVQQILNETNITKKVQVPVKTDGSKNLGAKFVNKKARKITT